jgi:hypothetical protein
MCSLRPPFDANNISALALKIIRAVYPPIPPTYSASLK